MQVDVHVLDVHGFCISFDEKIGVFHSRYRLIIKRSGANKRKDIKAKISIIERLITNHLLFKTFAVILSGVIRRDRF